ncbi:MAG: patatin-like phospholipase family protein [Saprospiraceae bacterium]|nr:patatin-like phospholipase family protein [Saprospiraceae bacterium]
MFKKKIKVGITLSGGGARGIAHIGVLQALEEEGIFPDIICGTSAGAILGALYAYGYSPDEMLDIAVRSNMRRVFKLVLPIRGLTNQTYLLRQLQKYIPEDSFSTLQREFHIGVTNLNAGKHEVWHEGASLHDLVLASSAVPGIFQPIQINNSYYVDGGVMNNMPAAPIRHRCDFLIASNVVTKVEKSPDELTGLKSILARVFEISLWYRSRLNYDDCDTVIEPAGLNNYHIFNFSKTMEIYELGYQGAKRQLEIARKELEAIYAMT